jgi:ectoine hydroxylase-related dioxygenase (phytanoyl-CoA dioxygenase family)
VEVVVAALTDAEIEDAVASLRNDGYVVFRNVVDPAALEDFALHLAEEYDEARVTGELFEGGGSISGHLNCFPGERSRFIYDAVEQFGVVDIVRRWAPETVDHLRVTTNYNLPGSIVQHFHSDGLYTEAFLICNVAVVDTDLENGAIDVLPGTHRRFYKFWRYAIERKYRLSTRLPMSQGDVLVRVSTMWHRGMPNRTDVPRPMMSLTFGESSAPDVDPFMINDGRVQYAPNWYGTGRAAQLKEKTFARLPWVYSTSRFARSLVGNKGYSSW